MSLSEKELRELSELRQAYDRFDALKNAGLLPEFTEPVAKLIQDKLSEADKEKEESRKAEEPPPPVSFSKDSSREEVQSPSVSVDAQEPKPEVESVAYVQQKTPEEVEKPTAAQDPQRETQESAPAQPDTMQSIIRDLESTIATPSAPATEAEPQAVKSESSQSRQDAIAPPSLGSNQQNTKEPLANVATSDVNASGSDDIQDFSLGDAGQSQSSTELTMSSDASTHFQAPVEPTVSSKPADAVEETPKSNMATPAETLDAGVDKKSFKDLGPEDPDAHKSQSQKTREQVMSRESEKPTKSFSDRRQAIREQKIDAPTTPNEQPWLDRWKAVQAQQAMLDDKGLKIGQGKMPNATPGGSHAAVSTSKAFLASEAESANAQLGALLERLARGHAILVNHIREANRILDEAQY
jgi:hypothetical protein